MSVIAEFLTFGWWFMVFGLTLLPVLYMIFGLPQTLPDQVLRWIGAGIGDLGETNATGQMRGGIAAAGGVSAVVARACALVIAKASCHPQMVRRPAAAQVAVGQVAAQAGVGREVALLASRRSSTPMAKVLEARPLVTRVQGPRPHRQATAPWAKNAARRLAWRWGGQWRVAPPPPAGPCAGLAMLHCPLGVQA